MKTPLIRLRAIVALFLLAQIPLSGCFGAMEGDLVRAVRIPYPSVGETGVLSDGARDLEVRFTGLLAFQDASDSRVEGIAMKTRSVYAKGTSASAVHLIDERGYVPLVVAECEVHGTRYPQGDRECQRTPTWSGSYLGARLPGALGASPFWGRTLAEGVVTVDYGLLGERLPSEYTVTLTPDRCARLTLNDAGVGYRSQFMYVAFGIPESLLLCEDSSLPHAATIPRWGTFTLRSHQAGDGAALTARGVGADPSEAARASSLQPVAAPLPWRDDYDPANLSVSAAYQALRAHPGAGEWLAAHPGAMLVSSHIERHGGGPLLLDSSIGAAGYAVRALRFDDSDGTGFSARVEKTWNSMDAAVTVLEWNVEQASPGLDRPPAGVVPQATLLAKANATIGMTIDFTTVTRFLPNEGVPMGPGHRYFLIAWRGTSESFVPLSTVYDASTGSLLAFHVPTAQAKALTGLSESDLRR